MMKSEMENLREQGVSEALLSEAERFCQAYPVDESCRNRCIRPQMPFFGGEILEMAIAGLLAGENLLLCGSKATGKNILAENLAWMFGRPVYNISFHVNTDSSTLIGTDTFRDNEVQLRKGPVYQCASFPVGLCGEDEGDRPESLSAEPQGYKAEHSYPDKRA